MCWNDLVEIGEDAKGAMVLQAESKNFRLDVIRWLEKALSHCPRLVWHEKLNFYLFIYLFLIKKKKKKKKNEKVQRNSCKDVSRVCWLRLKQLSLVLIFFFCCTFLSWERTAINYIFLLLLLFLLFLFFCIVKGLACEMTYEEANTMTHIYHITN